MLKYAATLGETEARYVNAAFTAHEVEAIATAEPTSGAHDLVRAWSQTCRPLAIVGNNSATAIEAYLDLYSLRSYVTYVSARTSSDTALLKPNHFLLKGALSALAASGSTTVFVGDSATDIEAAHAAKIVSIGYANKPGKIKSLGAAGPEIVVTTVRSPLSKILSVWRSSPGGINVYSVSHAAIADST